MAKLTPETDRVTLWCGRPIADLTRAELIEALHTMARLYTGALRSHSRDLRVLFGGKRSE